MTEIHCDTCRWFEYQPERDCGCAVGECRRHAPTLAFAGTFAGMFPEVRAGNYCGDYEAKPIKNRSDCQPQDYIKTLTEKK